MVSLGQTFWRFSRVISLYSFQIHTFNFQMYLFLRNRYRRMFLSDFMYNYVSQLSLKLLKSIKYLAVPFFISIRFTFSHCPILYDAIISTATSFSKYSICYFYYYRYSWSIKLTFVFRSFYFLLLLILLLLLKLT